MSIVNFGDLKQAVIKDLRRDDLTDVVADKLEAVIRRYQRKFLYATPVTSQLADDGVTVLQTVAGANTYQIPPSFIAVTLVRLLFGNVWRHLQEEHWDRLLYLDSVEPTVQSIPSHWSRQGDRIRFFQTPDQVYTYELTGLRKVPIPTDDTVSNFWTTNAADLVRYGTLAEIYQTVVKEPDLAAMMKQSEQEHLMSLIGESIEKSTQQRVRAWW